MGSEEGETTNPNSKNSRKGDIMPLTYEQRKVYACDVCGNVPSEEGELEHGRGCYVVDADGGGSTWVDFEEDEGFSNSR